MKKEVRYVSKYQKNNDLQCLDGIYIPKWMVRRTEISWGTKCCYGKLLLMCDENGQCSATLSEIAESLNISVSRVGCHLNDLEMKELIRIERKSEPPNLWMRDHLPTHLICTFPKHTWMNEKDIVPDDWKKNATYTQPNKKRP